MTAVSTSTVAKLHWIKQTTLRKVKLSFLFFSTIKHCFLKSAEININPTNILYFYCCHWNKSCFLRLNLQLERYQETLRQTNPNRSSATTQKLSAETENDIFTEEHQNHSHVPVSWGKVNSHTLAPLLNAYEETISEKNGLLENYELEFAKFSCKLKEIARENEILHTRLTEDKRCSKKLCEELDAIKTELKAAKEQNDVLIKKCALKQDKVEEVLKCYERKGIWMYSFLRGSKCKLIHVI